MSKKKYPAKPELYEHCIVSITESVKVDSPLLRIPAIAASECRMVLAAYYGSTWKAGWALVACAIHAEAWDIYYAVLLGISDRVGWTKVYDVPESDEYIAHKQRHGRKCSGSPNCDNMNCIKNSVPRWFRFLTRWDV